MKILIKNGRVIDPATKTDEVSDMLIVDGRISKRSSNIDEEADQIIDADGCFIMPGFIDLHVHLREPGYEYKETIESGSRAAAKGGFTTICAMPNTNPVIDNSHMIKWLIDKASKEAIVNVLPVGAITIGQLGNKLSDIRAMKESGACAISEDGKSVMDAKLYKEAMCIAKDISIPVLAHCEDKDLVGNGVINKGAKSIEFHVDGISNEVEDVIVQRDIQLAKETNVHLHLCHCSTAKSVMLVAKAKLEGVRVTAEVCPHHFTLTQDDMISSDTNFKMNPPLRSEEDKQELLKGLNQNIIEVIATDHAPHHADEKNKPLNEAPFGIIGLETAVALTVTELLNKSIITPMQMAEKLSYNPARILNIDKGSLEIGKIADITIINPNEEYKIDLKNSVSKSRNTPFEGRIVKGKVKYTIVNGTIVYSERNEKND